MAQATGSENKDAQEYEEASAVSSDLVVKVWHALRCSKTRPLEIALAPTTRGTPSTRATTAGWHVPARIQEHSGHSVARRRPGRGNAGAIGRPPGELPRLPVPIARPGDERRLARRPAATSGRRPLRRGGRLPDRPGPNGHSPARRDRLLRRCGGGRRRRGAL